MTREQMIAWLILEGWEPETRAVYKGPWLVAACNYVRDSNKFASIYRTGIGVDIHPSPRGWKHFTESDLRVIVNAIEKSPEKWT